MIMRATVLLASALGLAAATPLFPRQNATCNGEASFCGRKYSNITFVGSHDAAFVGDIADPRVNQEKSVTDQLNAGIRYMEAQTHNDSSHTLSMCHTSCLLENAGTLVKFLTTIKTWLDGNPSEVLTLLLANGDNVDVSLFDSAFQASQLKQYAFVPSTSPNALTLDQWPTLGEMVSNKSRLVVFLDYGANQKAYPYILSEFDSYIFETPYDTTDPNFGECTLNRPANGSADGRMYIMNHFLDTNVFNTGVLIPDNSADYQTNAATGKGSIGAQAALCLQKYGRVPNFVLVDMFDRGDVFTAQKNLNGISS